MHVLYKLILLISKMFEGAKQECVLVEINCVSFFCDYVINDTINPYYYLLKAPNFQSKKAIIK